MSANPSLPKDQLLDLIVTLKKTTPEAAKGILNGQPVIAAHVLSLMVSMGAFKEDIVYKRMAEWGVPPPSQPAPQARPHQPVPSAYPAVPSAHPSASSTPVPAIPPHMHSQAAYSNPYRTATPPHSTPTPPMAPPPPQSTYGGYPNGYNHHQPPPSHHHAGYNAPGPGQYPPPGPPTAYGAPPPVGGPGAPAAGYPGYGPPPTHHAPRSHPPAAPAAISAEHLAATLAAIPDDQKALVLSVLQMTPQQIYALAPGQRDTYIQLRAALGFPVPEP